MRLFRFEVAAFQGRCVLGSSQLEGGKIQGPQSLGVSKFGGVKVWGRQSLGVSSFGVVAACSCIIFDPINVPILKTGISQTSVF